MGVLKHMILGLAGVALVSGASSQAQAEWQPNQPIELIIPAGTGGGADQIARLLQSLIQKKGLTGGLPIIPINKPGGSGGEGYLYMQQNAGDNHKLLVTLNSFYTTPLIQEDLNIDITNFTPIKLMGMDTFLLWVPADSEISSLDEYVATVKDQGMDWSMGGTGSGQEDSILTAMLEAEFGMDMTYVPFPGGGTVAKNLVGKHVNSTVNNPAEQIEFWRAGKSKPLVQFTEERMELFPDVPTARELGVDIVYFMQRSINGPPGMSGEAQAYYIDLFGKVFQSEEWQNYCNNEGMFCDEKVGALEGEALGQFHDEQLMRHEQLIERVGAEAITSE